MAPSPPDPEVLVRTHQVALWRYLRALGAPADLAEDILQDTFLIALDKLAFDQGPAATAAFLRRTGRHLLLRRRRDQSRREQILVEIGARLWERRGGDDGGAAWVEALRDCVAGLGARQQQALALFYGEDRGRTGTGAVLGIEAHGVRSLLQRTRALLRACIERKTGGER